MIWAIPISRSSPISEICLFLCNFLVRNTYVHSCYTIASYKSFRQLRDLYVCDLFWSSIFCCAIEFRELLEIRRKILFGERTGKEGEEGGEKKKKEGNEGFFLCISQLQALLRINSNTPVKIIKMMKNIKCSIPRCLILVTLRAYSSVDLPLVAILHSEASPKVAALLRGRRGWRLIRVARLVIRVLGAGRFSGR